MTTNNQSVVVEAAAGVIIVGLVLQFYKWAIDRAITLASPTRPPEAPLPLSTKRPTEIQAIALTVRR